MTVLQQDLLGFSNNNTTGLVGSLAVIPQGLIGVSNSNTTRFSGVL